MTRIETSASPETAARKTSWFRRAALGVAFAVAGFASLGAVTTPAQAYWYDYGPHYYYYHPYYYGSYGYPAYYGSGWGWHGGWGWHHGYYHHW